MMQEPLTIADLAGGAIVADLNCKLQDASASLDATDNPKAVAKISLDIKMSAEDGDFRRLESTVKFTAPAPSAKSEMRAVNEIESKRVITAARNPKDDQLSLPGVVDITRKLVAQA